MSEPQKPPDRHMNAREDVDAKAILWTAVAIAVALMLVGVAAYFLWKVWRPGDRYDGPNAAFDFHIKGPVLESAPQDDYKAYMAEKEKLLQAWQWVDPKAGTVRIPIEEAMRRMAQQAQQQTKETGAPSSTRRQP